jgi:hypothetical protein
VRWEYLDSISIQLIVFLSILIIALDLFLQKKEFKRNEKI